MKKRKRGRKNARKEPSCMRLREGKKIDNHSKIYLLNNMQTIEKYVYLCLSIYLSILHLVNNFAVCLSKKVTRKECVTYLKAP